MEKKYQIFISSTREDLKKERKAVIEAILHMQQLPIAMEFFGACSTEQWEMIRSYLDSTDYFILILGKRYGTLMDETGMSFTEAEFEYAKSHGIPILAFIKSDDADYKGTGVETDKEKKLKMESFLEKVKSNRNVEWFNGKQQLAKKVIIALHNEMQKNNRPGWIRKQGRDQGVDDVDGENDNIFKPDISSDEFKYHDTPADGQYKQMGYRKKVIAEGEWKRGKLIKGVEYDWLIRVTKGNLIFKLDCPEDPYDASEDFAYEKMEQYGWEFLPYPFHLSEDYIITDGIDKYYVVDMKVDEGMEQMFNIRTLEAFLQERAPDFMSYLKEIMEIEE